MRPLAGLSVISLVFFGIYYVSLKKMPGQEKNTAATQIVGLTGIRTDLLQIAQTERSYVAQNGSCVSLDQLVSSSALAMPHSGRDGYTYEVDCAGTDFTVSATHPPAPEGYPIHYPTISVDSLMQVTRSD
ncbi:MAG TPA: hypothetical protein VFQ00_01730 [Terriglobales bacterium]|nr:hypothetical protein [Terriglobales bacterium]